MTKIEELEAIITELQERVAKLESQRNHTTNVICGLLDGKPWYSAILAMMYGFSEKEDDALMDFIRWAFLQHQNQTLTAEKARAEWAARMPQTLRSMSMLDQIIHARRKDGDLDWLTAIFDAEQQGPR